MKMSVVEGNDRWQSELKSVGIECKQKYEFIFKVSFIDKRLFPALLQ